MRLNRNLGTIAHLEAGEFCFENDATHICCPLCSNMIVLDVETYHVAGDGRVTPRWHCQACIFSEWITLEPML